MKIGSIDIRVSIVTIAVVILFAFALAATYFLTGDTGILIWGIPTVILLFVLPVALNYMSMREYADLKPVYEREAKNARIKMINESMIGKVVRIEGVVESVRFRFLNRPQFIVADRSGEISVKIFTSVSGDVKVNDVVEVLGQVIRRYVATGDPVINGVSIKKIEKTIERKAKPSAETAPAPGRKD
jgi:RecJ-like exonuclease